MQNRYYSLFIISFLVATILMLPVLLWPHYGLFSDAGHLLIYPKQFFQDFPDSLKTLLPGGGRWIPLFYGYNLLIYSIFPENAWIYFAGQWIMLIVSLISISLLLMKITNNFHMAILGLAIFCSSSSFFECFYTLDKSEPRMVMFSSLILLSAYMANSYTSGNKKVSFKLIFLQCLLGVSLVFSKETGAFLALAFLGTVFLIFIVSRKKPPILFNKLAITHILVLVTYIVLFKYLDLSTQNQYVSYALNFSIIYENVSYYFLSSPELLIAIVLSLLYLFRTVIKVRANQEVTFRQSFYLLLTLSALGYFIGISIWRIPLDYYLMPAHLFASLIIPIGLWSWSKR